ncbi:MAG: dihydroneopterin aldolase [Methylobacteriaceae bacterium]|nr:dihydroneopterin aldolase [Methylobacteriaceae bacterium]
MTQFLASVIDAEEAGIALAHGADIIDAKDPSSGALGALAPDEVRMIVEAVAGRRPVSAVTGDLPMEPKTILAAASSLAATGVTYLKIGLFPSPQREACIRTVAALADRVKLVGVMFADNGADAGLATAMADAGFHAAMVDTADKSRGRLLDYLDPVRLNAFVEACHDRKLLAGLAGSLELPDIPRLLLLAPDFLGFRGALCGAGGRTSRIDPRSTDEVRELIPPDPVSAPLAGLTAGKVDYRLLAARCFSADPRKNGATDRIFVHDFVLPVRIGAYARERATPQNVRFNVDIDVSRSDHVPENMRDVLSYDIVTDGIRMIVAPEHISLVETLAERVAALVLAHPRVARVMVRVEKLDVGPGSVGVEIVRERAAGTGAVHQLFSGAAGSPTKSAP